MNVAPKIETEKKFVRFFVLYIKNVETFSFLIVGALLSVSIFISVVVSGMSLWGAMSDFGNTMMICIAIDRMLFVLMLVEILHTVRDSFRSGALVCEPFLVVGLIASIRRVLSITLQSSQEIESTREGVDSHQFLYSAMLELSVLAGLILVMVISIYLLRLRPRQEPASVSPSRPTPPM